MKNVKAKGRSNVSLLIYWMGMKILIEIICISQSRKIVEQEDTG